MEVIHRGFVTVLYYFTKTMLIGRYAFRVSHATFLYFNYTPVKDFRFLWGSLSVILK